MNNMTATEVRMRNAEGLRAMEERRYKFNRRLCRKEAKWILRTYTNYGPILWLTERFTIMKRLPL